MADMKWLKRLGLAMFLALCGPLLMVARGDVRLGQDWRTADRSPAGIAPVPAKHPQAVVQVYAARAFNWRGILAVHTWIAVKPRGAPAYKVHQVIGWRVRGGLPAVVSIMDLPDRNWYGAAPEIIADLRGAAAAAAIPKITRAVADYPHAHEYGLWPGPNSNTFVAHVLRQVPELDFGLPVTAIGKDYLPNAGLFDASPSGTGYQLSLFGIAGVMGGYREGLELNLLSLSFGIDLFRPAIKLPGWGRLGIQAHTGK